MYDTLKTFAASFLATYAGSLLLALVILACQELWKMMGCEGAENEKGVTGSAQNPNLICTDCGSENSQLFDPMFNIRETAKQLILLEDHLAHKAKHCVDCVSKHLLFAEGLLEEAVTLDKRGKYLPITTKAIKSVQEAAEHFAEHRFARAQEMQQMVRQVRKGLVKESFDSIKKKPTENLPTF